MINSQLLFEEQEQTFKYYRSIQLSRKKNQEATIIGPWFTPKAASQKKNGIKGSSFKSEADHRKRSLNEYRTFHPLLDPERSMLISRRLKTHVVEYIDSSAFDKINTRSKQIKVCSLRELDPRDFLPKRLQNHAKHPLQPSFISLFKYKQQRIKAKRNAYDGSSSKREKIDERHLFTIPSLNSRADSRRGKIVSLGFQKVISQRLNDQKNVKKKVKKQTFFQNVL